MTGQLRLRPDRRTSAAAHWVASAVVAAGLFIDAVVHFALASKYDVVTAAISEGTLFRVQAAVAIAAGVLTLLVRRRVAYAVAAVVAGTAVAALLISTYTHVGQIGPFPDMFEPTWFAAKRVAVIAEAAAVLAAIAGLLLPSGSTRAHSE